MTTMTKARPRTDRSALEDLDALDVAITAADERVPLLVRERHDAARALREAQGARERFHTWPEAEQDEDTLAGILATLRVAEAAAARDWDHELEAAQEDAEDARRRHDEFLGENQNRLAVQLIAAATDARDRRLRARVELIAADDTDYWIEGQWSRIVGHPQRPAGGGEPRRPGLLHLPTPLRDIATLQHLDTQAHLMREAVSTLRKVVPTAILRVIPAELDAEVGGVSL